jgi:Domain of unknown function (DUF1902)
MRKNTFYVKALWDDEAKVFYSDSDIVGLHIETETLEAFELVMYEVAPELLVANHVSAEDFKTKPLSALIPSWMWQPPAEHSLSYA